MDISPTLTDSCREARAAELRLVYWWHSDASSHSPSHLRQRVQPHWLRVPIVLLLSWSGKYTPSVRQDRTIRRKTS